MKHTGFGLLSFSAGFFLAFLIIFFDMINSNYIFRYWIIVLDMFLLAISLKYFMRFLDHCERINTIEEVEVIKNEG